MRPAGADTTLRLLGRVMPADVAPRQGWPALRAQDPLDSAMGLSNGKRLRETRHPTLFQRRLCGGLQGISPLIWRRRLLRSYFSKMSIR
jgi:hypothetical protein